MEHCLTGSFSAQRPDGLRLFPGTEIRAVHSELGTLTLSGQAVLLTRAGDGLAWRIPAEGAAPRTLELEEFHSGVSGAFAYRVSVNGRPVATRTYEPLVSAYSHVFFELDGAPDADGMLTVELTFLGETPVGICRGWLYTDLDACAAACGGPAPLRVNEYIGAQHGRVEALSRLYGPHTAGELGVTFHLPVLGMSRSQIRRAVNERLAEAERSGLPAQWMLSNWWAGVSYAPDGLGGYFGDLRYSQLCVDQVTGREHPTVPNMWGSTLWPTMNDPRMNEVLCRKMAYTMEYLSRRLSLAPEYQRRSPSFVLGWGTGYWFYNNWDGGDFHDTVREAARRDGVELQPRRGLSGRDKDWLFRNNARYHAEQAACIRTVLAHTPERIDGGEQVPACQYRDRLFTHTVQAVLYPSLDDRHPAWLSGMGEHMWASSEMYAFTDPRQYDYSFSNTVLGCANLEVTMLTKEALAQFLVDSYAYGMEYVTLFNPDKEGEDAAMTALDARADCPAQQTQLYRRPLLDVDMVRDRRPDGSEQLPLTLTDVRTDADGKLTAVSPEARAEATLTVEPGDTLWVHAEAMATGFEQLQCAYSFGGPFYAASFVSVSQPLDWFNKNRLYLWQLPASPGTQVTVRLSLSGATTLKALRIARDWKEPVWLPPALTARQLRTRRLLVQQRLQAERMLRQAEPETDPAALARAREQMAAGEYAEAAAVLAAALARTLPRSYALTEAGALAGIPFTAQLSPAAGGAVLTLTEYDETHAVLHLWSAGDGELTLTAEQGHWTAAQSGRTVTLTRTPDGERQWSFPLRAEAEPLPAQLEGLCRCFGDGELRLTVQPEEIGECAEFLPIPVEPDCRLHRRTEEDGAWSDDPPQEGDAVRCRLNADGRVAELWAESRLCRAVLAQYIPPCYHGTQHNGFLVTESGERFGLSYNCDYTKLRLPSGEKQVKSCEQEELTALFVPGSRWDIRYAPCLSGDRVPRAEILTRRDG